MLSFQHRRMLEKIYCLYEQKMYYIAFSVLKNEQAAEDAVHTAIINVAKHLKQFSSVESDECRYYVLKAVKNVAIDIYRKNYMDAAVIEDVVTDAGIQKNDSWLEQLIAKHDAGKVVSQCIGRMPDSLKEFMNLKYFCELENNEIAQILQITPAAVRKRNERLREYIRESVGEEYEE